MYSDYVRKQRRMERTGAAVEQQRRTATAAAAAVAARRAERHARRLAAVAAVDDGDDGGGGDRDGDGDGYGDRGGSDGGGSDIVDARRNGGSRRSPLRPNVRSFKRGSGGGRAGASTPAAVHHHLHPLAFDVSRRDAARGKLRIPN